MLSARICCLISSQNSAASRFYDFDIESNDLNFSVLGGGLEVMEGMEGGGREQMRRDRRGHGGMSGDWREGGNRCGRPSSFPVLPQNKQKFHHLPSSSLISLRQPSWSFNTTPPTDHVHFLHFSIHVPCILCARDRVHDYFHHYHYTRSCCGHIQSDGPVAEGISGIR